jgi:hypothetical protein
VRQRIESRQSERPDWVSAELFARTRATFEPMYGRALSDDEVAEILTNMGQLFRVLFDPTPQSVEPKTFPKT